MVWEAARHGSALPRYCSVSALTSAQPIRCASSRWEPAQRWNSRDALVHRPAVLLMDEATVGLDPASRRHLLDEVLGLREHGVGVLWASHLVDEAEAADRVIVLHKGKSLAEGRPEELVASAGTATLAEAFLQMTGSAVPRIVPMNQTTTKNHRR